MRCRYLVAILGALISFLPLAVRAQGMLIPTDESLSPLQLTQHRVDLRIEENAAVTHVSQVFANHTSFDLEATYYFAVPEGAVTTDFAIWMNGERISGEVLERGQARQVYERIVRRVRDPGLLEYIDGTLFQASIFPVPARGEQTVEIEYASVLQQVGTMLQYRYPIHRSTGERIPQFVVSGDISSSQEITTVFAPTHEIEVVRKDAHHVAMGMEMSSAVAARDFTLFVGTTGEEVGFSMLTYDLDGDGGDPGYFMMTLSPSAELDESSVLPKQLTLVVDTSGSMRGDKLAQAQDLLRYCVSHLKSVDTFNIIGFSTRVRPAFDEPRLATEENRLAAIDYIDGLRARGNTNISQALTRALSQQGTPDRPHIVLFVTDGLPTEGETDVTAMVDSVRGQTAEGSRRLFAFGVGYDVNTRLIEGIARSGRGRSGYVRPEENIREVIGPYYDRVSAPVMTDLQVAFGEMTATQVYPDPLPDLYRGDQITLFGRYEHPLDSTVTIQGETAHATVTLRHEVPLRGDDRASEESRSFVASLWAHRCIAALLDEINQQGETPQRVAKVVELGSRWGIVTPYTSYLALDPSEQQRLRVARTGEGERGGQITDLLQTQSGLVDGSVSPMGVDPYAIPGFPVRYLALDPEVGAMTATPVAPEPLRRPHHAEETRADAEAASVPMGGVGQARGRGGSGSIATGSSAAGDTGQAAVEAAISANQERDRLVLADRQQVSRQVAGRYFIQQGGVWVQDGYGDRTADRVVSYLSDEYFTLLSEHPEISDILALGEQVRFELSGLVYEIRP
ncbi:MAG: VWA domain-containing protein [Bradymonadales bacterium]|nr:VWA domain-containing protein [Bradymonadales bacterium]